MNNHANVAKMADRSEFVAGTFCRATLHSLPSCHNFFFWQIRESMHSVFLYHAIQVPKCLLLLSPLQLSCVGCLYIEAVIGKQLALFTSSLRYRGNACIHLCAGWDGYGYCQCWCPTHLRRHWTRAAPTLWGECKIRKWLALHLVSSADRHHCMCTLSYGRDIYPGYVPAGCDPQ